MKSDKNEQDDGPSAKAIRTALGADKMLSEISSFESDFQEIDSKMQAAIAAGKVTPAEIRAFEQAKASLAGSKSKLESIKAKGGAKTSRSETVTVRLDPETRYLAELAARARHQTLSTYIESAISDSIERVVIKVETKTDADGIMSKRDVTLTTTENELWDVDPAERLARLAITCPHLMSHEEQQLWKVVEDSGILRKGFSVVEQGGKVFFGSQINWQWLSLVGFSLLRDHWDTLTRIAAGELSRSDLPRFPFPAEP